MKFNTKYKRHKLFLIFYTIFSIFFLRFDSPSQKYSFDIQKIKMNKPFIQKPILNIGKIDKSSFPIDIVYTWVDGRDPNWLNEFEKAKEGKKIRFNKNDFLNRYVDIEEIRYSLRSVEKFAPWVNKIFIVTCDQYMYWINKNHSKIKFISHSEIYPQNSTIPSFNSNSIEFLLYRIPGLSEHFIYLNDDMYFGRPVMPTDFFTEDGKNIIISNTVSWSNIDHFNKEYNEKCKFNNFGDYIFSAFTSHTIIVFRNKFNVIFPYEYSHIPFSLTKTICEEAYLNFQNDIDITIGNRFREYNDLHMQTLMVQYGVYSNQSVIIGKDPKKALFVISKTGQNNFLILSKVTYNPPKLLSINVNEDTNRDAIQGFLDFMFENISSFELPEKPPKVRFEQKKIWIKYYEKNLRRKKR